MSQYATQRLPTHSNPDEEIPYSVSDDVKKHYALGMIEDNGRGHKYVRNFTEPKLYEDRVEAERVATAKTYQYGKPFIIYEAVAVVERILPKANVTPLKSKG